jgi:hypothetical protein
MTRSCPHQHLARPLHETPQVRLLHNDLVHAPDRLQQAVEPADLLPGPLPLRHVSDRPLHTHHLSPFISHRHRSDQSLDHRPILAPQPDRTLFNKSFFRDQAYVPLPLVGIGVDLPDRHLLQFPAVLVAQKLHRRPVHVRPLPPPRGDENRITRGPEETPVACGLVTKAQIVTTAVVIRLVRHGLTGLAQYRISGPSIRILSLLPSGHACQLRTPRVRGNQVGHVGSALLNDRAPTFLQEDSPQNGSPPGDGTSMKDQAVIPQSSFGPAAGAKQVFIDSILHRWPCCYGPV